MKTNTFFFLLLILCLLPACECEDLIPTDPGIPNTFIVEDLSIEGGLYLRFNRSVDTASFKIDETVLVDGGNPGDVKWFEGLRDVVIEIPDVANCNGSCEVSLTLQEDEFGSGIRSLGGELLDGDRDGQEGGVFEETVIF